MPSNQVSFAVNGRTVSVQASGVRRLADVLRDDLGLTGTKLGCHAGDCGACTVQLDGEQVCSCLVAVGQCAGRSVRTVEGLETSDGPSELQQAFLEHGAAQCGICTPGMLMAAQSVLDQFERPDRAQVLDGLAGVLCRCTGYQKIVEAVLEVADRRTWATVIDCADGDAPRASLRAAAQRAPIGELHSLAAGAAVGARLQRLDGLAKVTGRERYGADEAPADALWLRVVRSPHARARFQFGDLQAFVDAHGGLVGWISAEDIPFNRFAIFPDLRDQPALAEGAVRMRGEAVLALVGSRAAIDALDLSEIPLHWQVLEPVLEPLAALADALQGGEPIHERWADNILCHGRVVRGDVDAAMSEASIRLEATMGSAHVEHAYIEPEAGYARWGEERGRERVTVFATTQTPYMDRDELASMFRLDPEQVRIIPSAVGGGFGGKLDLSVQPLVVAAARKFGRPARVVYTRGESMLSSTKRHPARMRATLAAGANGELLAYDFHGDFNTGPYSSWGPTVANRVPIHASGPYRVSHVRALTRAVLTNNSNAGAFRGFGVPQSTLINELLMDRMAHASRADPLEFRLRHALRAGDTTATGQRLNASVGLEQCLLALRPAWHAVRARLGAADGRQGQQGSIRHGAGIACMWYGIGNTVIANPSSMTIGLKPDGRFMLFNGAIDIGQGTYTIMAQIAADALGVPVSQIDQVGADTDLTLDAGKSSASRQTFVSGNAARAAATELRLSLLRLLGAPDHARMAVRNGELHGRWSALGPRAPGGQASIAIAKLPLRDDGLVALGQGYFNPPTVPLDADGQGVPYACYGFAAQFAEIEVDIRLGTVRVVRIHAAHDVGRAINPTQVEGQIHGGIAQGLGLALMEEYVAGRTDNLHDYLIPTVGDMPEIVTHLIEDPEPLGPFGAKGVGEPALVATAPAILNAIHDATGVRPLEVPVTPDRLMALLRANAADGR